jgi:hypothetical protein
MVTIVDPSSANEILPVPAGIRTVWDSPVSRLVITHVEGVTRLKMRTRSPLPSRKVNCSPVPPEVISNETAKGHARPAGYVPATDPPADDGPYSSRIGATAAAGAAVDTPAINANTTNGATA